MISILLLLAGSGLAFAQSNALSTAPFLLSPVGIDYLGWLTPDQCRVNERCDIVVVDPQNGHLYLEQSDDLQGTRVYSDRSWGLSHRIEYEVEENLVHNVEDFWSTSISYRYEGRNLVQIDWSDGRSVHIQYDRRGRVLMMTDNEHRVDFVWGRDGSHRMVDSTGKTLNWVVSDSSIKVTDSQGMTTSTLYDDDQIIGWIDPRGLETRLEYTSDGLRLEQAGLRVWNLKQTNGRLTALELVGSGSWSWQYDARDRLTQVTDPTQNKLTLLRENERSVRMLRHNGFVDLSYSAEGSLSEISDVRGRLVSIERDVYGQITRLEDAVGEAFLFEREEGGLISKITLRSGGEWIIERDGDGGIRNLVFPNQEVWGITRDAWGNLTGIDRSHDDDFEFGWTNGVMNSISLPNNETWMLRRDGYHRLIEIQRPTGYLRLQRDVLGQIIGVTIEQEQQVSLDETMSEPDTGAAASIDLDPLLLAMDPIPTGDPITESREIQKTWSIERDVFGNIVGWQDLALGVGAWDAIESHRQGNALWKWQRDAAGRLVAIESGDERIDIVYDGSGMPIKWTRDEMVSTVKRNHWGWITNVDEQWLHHDPRGQIEKSGIYDLNWRWNRNASGHPLVVKGPYQVQVGFELDIDGSIERIRFPNGALQTFRLQQSGIAQWHTNEQGQEFTLPVVPRTKWKSSFQLSHGTASQHRTGVHTMGTDESIRTINYDSFHFVREICNLTSCLDLTYDPRGRLIEVEDGTGLPTRIVWGWNGWFEAPLLIGGTIGFHSPVGMIVQSAGEQNKQNLFWHHETQLGEIEQPFVDAAHFENGKLSWIDGSFASRDQRLYVEGIDRPLQNEQPWMADGNEAALFSFVSERSIWNQPMELLEQLGLVEFSDWVNPEYESPLSWVSSAWLEIHQPWAINPAGMPISEGEIETWFLQRILAGKSDPSSNEILFMLLNEPDIQAILTGDYPFQSTKCIPELAQFHSCG